ncbi:MAG: EthD domain-containing protein [Sphingomonadales bacterium]
MLKFISFFRKRPDIGHAEFHDYWIDTHAELVMRMPGLVRYVQNHPLPGTLTATSRFHGCAEVWLESAEALVREPGSPFWEEVAVQEAMFIDPDSQIVLPVDEKVVKQANWPREGMKVLRTLRSMAGKVPPVFAMPTVARYARNTVRGDASAFCAGYDASWFASPAVANAAAPHMRDPASLEIMIVREYVVKE